MAADDEERPADHAEAGDEADGLYDEKVDDGSSCVELWEHRSERRRRE